MKRLGGLIALADDAPGWKLDPVEQALCACRGGASAIQLRAKHATDRLALQWAAEIRIFTRERGVGFFVNDRFDLALAADADGVHLGQDDLPPERVPRELRSRLQIGRSTHSIDQVCRAREEPIDYIAFGPIYATESKQASDAPQGLDRLAAAVGAARPLPLVAIGGISLDNAAAVVRAGAAGIAVISAIAAADDPVAAARELSRVFGGEA